MPAPAPECRWVPVANVRPDPTQPRKEFLQDDIDSLAASIREKGQQTPVLVRPDPDGGPERYLVIAGERRWRAVTQIGDRDLLVVVRRDLTDAGDILDEQIIENLQRVPMTPMDEARAYQRRLDQLGGDIGLLAKRLGLRQAWRITERTDWTKPDSEDLFEATVDEAFEEE